MVGEGWKTWMAWGMSALSLAGRHLLALLILLAPLLILGSLRVRRILAAGGVLPIGTHAADLLSLRVLVAYPQTGELYMKWKTKTGFSQADFLWLGNAKKRCPK